ncbi:MAG: c-type cytochrome [Pseudomonadales bacterium]
MIVNKLVKSMLALFGATSLVLSMVAVAGTIEDQIAERIAPAGEVCIEGEECAVAAAAAPAAASGPRSGEDVYGTACLACHGTGAGGAPMLGNVDQWAPRIAKGLDILYSGGINGLPGTMMMAKGGCASCSDDEVKAAVDHMVNGSQ